MAKKMAGAKKMAAMAQAKAVRHARIELDAIDYSRLQKVAKANGLSVAAYIRQAVLKQIRRDEAERIDQ